MSTSRTVKIDAFPGSAFRYLDRDAVVCIDVISTSTTIVTAAAQGRETHPVAGIDEALSRAALLPHAIVAVEHHDTTLSFEMPNSPAALAGRDDPARPLVLEGASGTQLLLNAAPARAVYVACLRNLAATAAHLAAHHRQVVVLGAGWGSDFRCEDQIAAARLAGRLARLGFGFEDSATADLVERWGECDLGLVRLGRSAAHLRRRAQHSDLEFVLAHVDDLDLVCSFEDGVAAAISAPQRPLAVGSEAAGRVLPFRPVLAPALS